MDRVENALFVVGKTLNTPTKMRASSTLMISGKFGVEVGMWRQRDKELSLCVVSFWRMTYVWSSHFVLPLKWLDLVVETKKNKNKYILVPIWKRLWRRPPNRKEMSEKSHEDYN